ncbi:Atg14 domain-containing protein [Candidatus Pelagibacter sp.]|nr:Atg14 domain-containing protein [Candidatus Pelagibacter sp.]
MKKKQKKSKKRAKTKKKNKVRKVRKKINKIKKKSQNLRKTRFIKKKKKSKFKKLKIINYQPQIKKKQKKSLVLKLVKFQLSLKPQFNFKFSFGLEKRIQSFFDKISETISNYKELKSDEKKRIKIEKIEKERKEKIEKAKRKKEEEILRLKLKEQTLREEEKLERQRAKDIKLFLRKEQALLRIEQAEKQKQFLKQLRLDKQIEKFRIREVKELEKLEKISLKEKREDYSGLQERIDKLKEKYRLLRDQKIKERVEALGVKLQGDEDRETLLEKEKEHTLARQKIEFALESFYRSASSLVFQLNKRHITRDMSIFRCIDRRFETGEVFIKWDESSDDEWLLLIYIKNNSPDEGIVIEDKTNPEKNLSHEFKNIDIFKASDTMVDSLTQLIARKRAKNDN